jgi:pimeloyl-ACP methyl ester carboxylesterase
LVENSGNSVVQPISNFEYDERGAGTALLFLPGSFGTGAGWRLVLGHLGDRYRVVTTSLLG